MDIAETPDALADELLPDLTEQTLFAARPARLRPTAKRRDLAASGAIVSPPFEADGRNPAYVRWLVEQSMLGDARMIARQLAGSPTMWQNSFAKPDPRAAVRQASVWYTAYPLSLMTADGQSFLGALGDEALWEAFEKIGIEGIHTGPVKLAGGLSGWKLTPSIDGHFDRISMMIDPLFGTVDEFRSMCVTASKHHGTVIDDVVPAHTGKGADFRLAELNYGDYPGIYHMVDIPEAQWDLLPEVPKGCDAVNLTLEQEKALAEAGLIIGALQRVIFFEPGVKETNWSATPEIYDVHGVKRRWVYLHYFKAGQPSINWLDPTCAGMRLVMGDALHSLTDLGTGGLRLDANGFLGVEKRAADTAWSEGHPVSQAANQLIGSMVRKVGGFTFQELNLGMEDILNTGTVGPDLSYDFVTRPAYQYALLTGNTEFLRLVLGESLKLGIDQASLVHALQNHDELTYELVHFASNHRDDVYTFGGQELTGEVLAEQIRTDMRARMTGPAAPYNLTFVQNGIACTTASIIAATLGFTDLDALSDADIRKIRDAHLLLSMYNAWQPGVFALSGWDLVGALPLPSEQIAPLLAEGDTRWIERGAYDLTDAAPDAIASAAGIPKARALYGSLPSQLARESSFVSKLTEILKVRRRAGIATASLIDVPEVAHPGTLALINKLENGNTQVTVLNFTAEKVEARVQSDALPEGRVFDLASRRKVAMIDNLGGFSVELPAYGGLALVVREPKPAEAAGA